MNVHGVENREPVQQLVEGKNHFAELMAYLEQRLSVRVCEGRPSSERALPAWLTEHDHRASRTPRLAQLPSDSQGHPHRVLELNLSHALVRRMEQLFSESPDDPNLRLSADILLGCACLADGSMPPDPAAFAAGAIGLLGRAVSTTAQDIFD